MLYIYLQLLYSLNIINLHIYVLLTYYNVWRRNNNKTIQ